MIEFRLSLDRLTLADLIELESKPSLTKTVSIMARFVVLPNGEYMSSDAASAEILSLPLSQLKPLTAKFSAALMSLRDEAVPPPNSGG